MGEFLSYSIISGIVLLSLYLGYRLFLARDNQHSFNRAVLLALYGVSFSAMPVWTLLESSFRSNPTVDIAIASESITGSALPAPVSPAWSKAIIWIFIAGMIVALVKAIINWCRLTRVIRTGKKISREGYTLVLIEDETYAPFSWMHYMIISKADYESNASAITAHELRHITSRHWIDLLIAQGVCIVNWFNPAAWLMRDDLMLIHEYQADMSVIDEGHDIREYQKLLIKKAVGARLPSLANSLNHSKLKKRITMMYKEKSGAGRRLKVLALVPMLALGVAVVSLPKVNAAVSTIRNSDVSLSEDSKNAANGKIRIQIFKVTDISNDGKETTVRIKGDGLGNKLTVSGGTFTSGGKTIKANALDCSMTDGVAVITAKFKFSGEYKNPTMTLTINGEEIPFNLENLANDSGIKILNAGASESDRLAIYFDGKEIDREELDKISSDDIASVSVDKKNRSVVVRSKKSAPGDIKIFLDGKQIGADEMNALSPNAIESMSVDNANNTILITSKK